jgi:hypothetical protein
MGARTATTALVEQNDTENGRVKIAAHRRTTSATGTAVKDDYRDAVRVTALFDIDAMTVANL